MLLSLSVILLPLIFVKSVGTISKYMNYFGSDWQLPIIAEKQPFEEKLQKPQDT